MTPIHKALLAKDLDKAIGMLAELRVKRPEFVTECDGAELYALLEYGSEAAVMDFGNKWQARNKAIAPKVILTAAMRDCE